MEFPKEVQKLNQCTKK